jgi:signal transduction histidine kinase
VANISHELRTPMSGVLGMTELLLGMPLQDEQKELATFIYESASNLLTVLNELLDFSRLEAGKLTLEEGDFSPRRVVEEVAASVQLSAGRKGLAVKSEVDDKLTSEVYGDFRRIKQVLQHIVQNALKFTEKGSLTISASLEKQVGAVAHVKFAVKDTGIGMTPEALESVFAPFVQADGSSTRKYGGIGLGLSISKRLVKMMSGTLMAKSKQDEGSVFWFIVPLQLSGNEHGKR